MWSVNAPKVSASDVVEACASGIRDKNLARRLRAASADLAANHQSFRQVVEDVNTRGLTGDSYAVQGISGAEMQWLYEKRLVDNMGAGRAVYEALRDNALNKLCSYCQYGIARTIDHFVPQSAVPYLAIDPWNLVPCCGDCNHELLDSRPKTKDTEFIHPYVVPKLGRWLFARLEHVNPPVLVFEARPGEDVDPVLARRVIHQFSALKLDQMYSIVSGVNLTSISQQVALQGHASDAKLFLEEMAAAGRDNERGAVIYEALSKDVWFYEEGFRYLAW